MGNEKIEYRKQIIIIVKLLKSSKNPLIDLIYIQKRPPTHWQPYTKS